MDPYKAVGPDGFGALVYQKYWQVVCNEVVSVVQDVLNFGKLPKQLNHTLITVAPKVDNTKRTSQFRPISLCNTLYKIIAKRNENLLLRELFTHHKVHSFLIALSCFSGT